MGVPFNRMPLDGYTLINWKMNEATATVTNNGNGGSCTLTTNRGTPVMQARLSPMFSSADFETAAMYSPNTSVGEVTNKFTVSFWFYQAASSNGAIGKKYQVAGSWSSPWTSWVVDGGGLGRFDCEITVSGTRYFINNYSLNETQYKPSPTAWHLLTFTWDGATGAQILYTDGVVVSTATSATGTLDYGSHGPYYVGGMATSDANTNWLGSLSDIRVENVVRSPGYIQSMYAMGIGQFGK